MVYMKFALISFLVLPELAKEDIRALIRIEGWIADEGKIDIYNIAGFIDGLREVDQHRVLDHSILTQDAKCQL